MKFKALLIGYGAITKNGYHTGVFYDGLVYDNLFSEGIPYNKWLNDFGLQDGMNCKIKPTDF